MIGRNAKMLGRKTPECFNSGSSAHRITDVCELFKNVT